jgi:hypothetical protein
MAGISDITILIGTITTSVGTLFGIGLSIYNITRREAQNFKIDVKEHWKIINPMPGYSEDKLYTSIRVINIGGRPLRISTAGYIYLNYESGGIFSESVMHSNTTIPVDGVHDYLADETDRTTKKIAYYYATSLTGKTKKQYMTSRIWVWIRFFLAKIKIWKKPPITDAMNEK